MRLVLFNANANASFLTLPKCHNLNFRASAVLRSRYDIAGTAMASGYRWPCRRML